jgi:glycerol-3-phosphate dehydrogenase (NAD(P)+)
MTNEPGRIGIIGGGAWGTALAQTVSRGGRRAILWAREPEVVAAINGEHANPLFLPGVALDSSITATADPAAAVIGADAVLLAVPAQHVRAQLVVLGPLLASGTPLVLCAKGIEETTGALLSEVVAERLPATPLAVLSGPTFAAEVARGLPTAVTLAIGDAGLGSRLIALLGTRAFRPYLSDDIVGAEIGGAVKNVLAIACGIVEGKRLGDNARAALITRGLAEMVRLAIAKGGRPETLMGLSGLGDLVLTCTGSQSRNHAVGVALGQGLTLAQHLAGRRSVAEGVASAAATASLAVRIGVDMPIVGAIDGVLHRGAGVDDAIDGLLSRAFKREAPGGGKVG